jgi:hypothetical protein
VSASLLKAIAVTAELTGTTMSEAAATVMVDDLSRYPEPQVLGALTRCRREIKGRLTIADVIQRLDDGRPGVEEAWAMIPKSEGASVVWTEEMAAAFGVACPLMDFDEVGARMAFKESYTKALALARDSGVPVKWTPSLGHDAASRQGVLIEAVQKGRLTGQHVAGLLPHLTESAEFKRLIDASMDQKLLVAA